MYLAKSNLPETSITSTGEVTPETEMSSLQKKWKKWKKVSAASLRIEMD